MRAFISIVVLVLAALSPIAAAAAQTPQLQGETRFIVVGPSAGDALRQLGVEPLVDAGNLAAAVLDPLTAYRLRSMGYAVAPDPVVRIVEPLTQTQAQAAPQPLAYADLVNAAPLHGEGITGAGVVVAVVDTGVDEERPELAGKQAWEYDATGTGQRGYCGKGLGLPYSAHGTMVAGIIVSGDSQLRGVAPDATLYDVIIARPELGCGGAFLSDIYNGLLAAAAGPDGQLGTEDDADVINLSFGTVALPWNWYYMLAPIDDLSRAYAELAQLMEELRHNYGVNIVVAAGNSGPFTSTVSPFCLSALCSGSVNPTLGVPSLFSSRGPDAFLRPAPHVMAPGENLTVLVPLEFGATTIASGTSFSAPLAAGTLALLRQLLPSATALDLEALLVSGGNPLRGAAWDPVVSGGTRVDAGGAASKLVAAAFVGEGLGRAEAQQPTAAVWSGSSATLRVKNLGGSEVTLVASAQVVSGLLAPGAVGEASVTPATITLAPGEEALLTVSGSLDGPGVAGIIVRLVDSQTGDLRGLALAAFVEPLEPGESVSLETSIYDWGFLPVPLRAPQPGVYSLNIYAYTLPVNAVVWDGAGPDSNPSTMLLSGDAIAYLNPVPFITAYPLASVTRVTVTLSTVTAQSLDDVYARMSELEERLALLEARIDAVEAQLARLALLESEIEALNAGLEALRSDLEALKTELDEERAVNEEQWREIQRLAARLDALEASLSDLRREIASIRDSLASLTARIDTLSLRLDRLSERVFELESSLDALTRDVADLARRADRLEEGLAEASANILDLQLQVASLQEELAGAKEALTVLASQLTRLSSDLQRLEAETARSLEEVNAGLEELSAAIASLSERVNSESAKLQEALARLEAAEKEISGLNAELEETLRAINELDNMIASVEQTVDFHEASLAALEARLSGLEKTLEGFKSSVDSELRSLQEQQESVEARISALEDQYRGTRIVASAGLALGLTIGIAAAGLAARKLLG